MANISNSNPNFDENIYLIATADPVQGGESGIDNMSATGLVNRTGYLKVHVDDIETALARVDINLPGTDVDYKGLHYFEVVPADWYVDSPPNDGNLVFIDSADSKFKQAISNVDGTNNPAAQGEYIGIADVSRNRIVYGGYIGIPGLNETLGTKIYLSATVAGTLTTTETDDYVGKYVSYDSTNSIGIILMAAPMSKNALNDTTSFMLKKDWIDPAGNAIYEALEEEVKNSMAGSGFVEWGKDYPGGFVVADGMYCGATSSGLYLGRDYSGNSGSSKTAYPILNIEGVLSRCQSMGIHGSPANSVGFTKPPAPTVHTEVSGTTAASVDYSAKEFAVIDNLIYIAMQDATAGTEFTNTTYFEPRDKVINSVIHLIEAWDELVSLKDVVYVGGNTQHRVTSYLGQTLVNTGLFTGQDTYSLHGDWQEAGDFAGYCARWSTMSDAHKAAWVNDKWNNLRYNGAGELVQRRIRVRDVLGYGTEWELRNPEDARLCWEIEPGDRSVAPRGQLTSILDIGASYYYGVGTTLDTTDTWVGSHAGCFTAGDYVVDEIVPLTAVANEGKCYAIPVAYQTILNDGTYDGQYNSPGCAISTGNSIILEGTQLVTDIFEHSDGSFYAGSYSDGKLWKSTDRGVHWVSIFDPGSMVSAICEHTDGYVYIGTSGLARVFRSNDDTIWTEVGTDISIAGNATVSQLISCEWSGTDYIYAACGGEAAQDGRIWRTSNGASWSSSESVEFGNATAIPSMLMHTDGFMYVGSSDRLIWRTNDGVAWSNVTGSTYTSGGAVVSMVSFYDDYNSTSYIYCASAAGSLWRSPNGATWYNLGVPGGVGSLISIETMNDYVYIGGTDAGGNEGGRLHRTSGGLSPTIEQIFQMEDSANIRVDAILAGSDNYLYLGVGATSGGTGQVIKIDPPKPFTEHGTNSVADAFTYNQESTLSYGTSGRPDGLFSDNTGAKFVQDLRLDANKMHLDEDLDLTEYVKDMTYGGRRGFEGQWEFVDCGVLEDTIEVSLTSMYPAVSSTLTTFLYTEGAWAKEYNSATTELLQEYRLFIRGDSGRDYEGFAMYNNTRKVFALHVKHRDARSDFTVGGNYPWMVFKKSDTFKAETVTNNLVLNGSLLNLAKYNLVGERYYQNHPTGNNTVVYCGAENAPLGTEFQNGEISAICELDGNGEWIVHTNIQFRNTWDVNVDIFSRVEGNPIQVIYNETSPKYTKPALLPVLVGEEGEDLRVSEHIGDSPGVDLGERYLEGIDFTYFSKEGVPYLGKYTTGYATTQFGVGPGYITHSTGRNHINLAGTTPTTWSALGFSSLTEVKADMCALATIEMSANPLESVELVVPILGLSNVRANNDASCPMNKYLIDKLANQDHNNPVHTAESLVFSYTRTAEGLLTGELKNIALDMGSITEPLCKYVTGWALEDGIWYRYYFAKELKDGTDEDGSIPIGENVTALLENDEVILRVTKKVRTHYQG